MTGIHDDRRRQPGREKRFGALYIWRKILRRVARAGDVYVAPQRGNAAYPVGLRTLVLAERRVRAADAEIYVLAGG